MDAQKQKKENQEKNSKKKVVSDYKEILDEILDEEWKTVINLDLSRKNKKQRISGIR